MKIRATQINSRPSGTMYLEAEVVGLDVELLAKNLGPIKIRKLLNELGQDQVIEMLGVEIFNPAIHTHKES